MLAEMLGWPMATFAMSIATADGGKSLTVGREVDTGVLTVKVQTPAVVTVDLRIVSPKAVQNGVTPATHKYADGARYASLKGIMQAKKKPIRRADAGQPWQRCHARHQLPQGSSCPRRARPVWWWTASKRWSKSSRTKPRSSEP